MTLDDALVSIEAHVRHAVDQCEWIWDDDNDLTNNEWLNRKQVNAAISEAMRVVGGHLRDRLLTGERTCECGDIFPTVALLGAHWWMVHEPCETAG